MCEPLKNKIRRGFSVKDGKTFGDKFLYDDVKSAVNGLKKEFIKGKEKYRRSHGESDYDDGYINGCEDTFYECIKLVDKWFEDVI